LIIHLETVVQTCFPPKLNKVDLLFLNNDDAKTTSTEIVYFTFYSVVDERVAISQKFNRKNNISKQLKIVVGKYKPCFSCNGLDFPFNFEV